MDYLDHEIIFRSKVKDDEKVFDLS